MGTLVVDQLIDQVDALIVELEEQLDLAVPLELAHQLRDELAQILPVDDENSDD